MKLIKTSVILLFSLCLFSCQKKQVRIYGEIKNPNGELLLLRGNLIYEIVDTLKIVDNKFDITIPLDKPALRSFHYGMGSKTLFLKPGFELKLFFDGRQIDSSYAVEGKGALENFVLDSLGEFLGDLDYRQLYNDNFKNACLTVENSYKRTLVKFDSLSRGKKLDLDFIDFVKKSIKYSEVHIVLMLNSDRKDSMFVQSRYIDSVKIEDPSLLNSQYYRYFLGNYLWFTTKKIQSEDYSDFLDQHIRVINNFKDKKIREYLLFDGINTSISVGSEKLEKYYQYFNSINTDSIYAKEMRRVYLKKQVLNAGNSAPSFTVVDLDSSSYSLNNFKGKFVYIDVWATWCRPCIQESPFLDTLKNAYQSKNIEFVGISLDKNKESWKKYLAKKEKNGILQLIANGDFKSDFAVNYQIDGIPSFILINPEGKIVNAHAPRPSSKKIRPLLDSLLKEN